MTSLAISLDKSQPYIQVQTRLQQLTAGIPAVIVPGLNNSDSNHWQSLWQNQLPESRRIFVHNWAEADLDKWRAGILKSLRGLPGPALLIGHSFGALASASLAKEHPDLIAGVFLVAPADPDKFGVASRLPQSPLNLPVSLIASDNDPWMKDSKAAFWSLLWGADFLRLKGAGHINSQSDIGYWPEGIAQLEKLVRRIKQNKQKR